MHKLMKGMGQLQLLHLVILQLTVFVVTDCLQSGSLELAQVFHTCRWKSCYLGKKICISLCLGLAVFHILIRKQEQFTVYGDARQTHITFFFAFFPSSLHLSALFLFFNLLSIDRAPVFVLLLSSSLCPLYQSVGCAFVLLFGIKSDSLRDWMCVAMACCIWKAIHSAGTLEFNLKQDWCWQTSHPSLAKCFLYCTHQLLMEKGAHATL